MKLPSKRRIMRMMLPSNMSVVWVTSGKLFPLHQSYVMLARLVEKLFTYLRKGRVCICVFELGGRGVVAAPLHVDFKFAVLLHLGHVSCGLCTGERGETIRGGTKIGSDGASVPG